MLKSLFTKWYLRTSGTNELRSRYNGRCNEADLCPAQCRCEGTRLDCSGRDLTSLPSDIPTATTHLYIYET